ncbi:MAG: methyltransferase domain-containing protein [Rhodanobacteraceae bacterium]
MISDDRNTLMLTALLADAAADCVPLLAGVTGTHGLLLDALGGAPPSLPGLGRWTSLRLRGDGMLDGSMRADVEQLPFVDDSFCVVLIRHAAGCGVIPESIANEAARVLAPHGLLMVVELHPWSAWRPWFAAQRRRGSDALRVVPPHRWQRALRAAGLAAGLTRRCGAPWPRRHGSRGLPRWLSRCGGAYLLDARKRNDTSNVRRLQPARSRAAAEHASLAPGAHRSRE